MDIQHKKQPPAVKCGRYVWILDGQCKAQFGFIHYTNFSKVLLYFSKWKKQLVGCYLTINDIGKLR